MRSFASLALLLAASNLNAAPVANEATAAGASSSNPFEFKGQRFDQPVDMTLPEFKFCKSVTNEQMECRAYSSVAGMFATLDYKIYRGKAYFLSVTMPRSFYSRAVTAFSEKYGQPCEVSEVPWQNALGMRQSNSVAMYCLKTGNFAAFQIGEKLDEMRAVYIDDDNMPPPEAPKVDF